MERLFTCIVCPKGCQMTAVLEGAEVLSVTGNACPRGKVYAENECKNPVRTVTSTVFCEGGAIVSVKTKDSVPKGKVFEVMKEINTIVAPRDTKIGDIIKENVADTGVSVVATSNA